MSHGSSNTEFPVGPGFGSTPFEERGPCDDLASAVSSLTTDELSGLTESLNAADAWDIDEQSGHSGGGILANQF